MAKRIIILVLFTLFSISFVFSQNSISGDTITREIYGTLTSKSGSKVKVTLDKEYEKLPKVNIEGELLKNFESEILSATVSGWLSIGEMKVNSIEKRIITLTLLKELSVITENGVKKNHFIPGKKIKFTWKDLAKPDELMFDKGKKIVDTDMDAAMLFFRKTVSINPKHAEAFNMIGMIHNEKKMYDSAIVYFKKAYTQDTANMIYCKNIAVTSTYLDQYADAYHFSDKAVLHAPSDAEAHYLRAMTSLYLLSGKINDDQKKQILSDLDFAVSVDTNDSYYYKERMAVRGYFHDDAGACEDAKKYQALEGSVGDDFVKQYCKE